MAHCSREQEPLASFGGSPFHLKGGRTSIALYIVHLYYTTTNSGNVPRSRIWGKM